MPRITALTDTDASPEAREIFAAIKSKIGMVPNLYRTTGHQPAVLKGLLGLGEALAGGGFDARTREAIALAVAGANGCDYCASAHTAIAKGLKVGAAEAAGHLRGIAAEPRTAAILALAIAVNETRGRIGDADLAQARDAGLSDADIVEVIGVTIANIFTNTLNHVFETEIDFPAVSAAA